MSRRTKEDREKEEEIAQHMLHDVIGQMRRNRTALADDMAQEDETSDGQRVRRVQERPEVQPWVDAIGVQVLKMFLDFLVTSVNQIDAQSNEKSAGYHILQQLKVIHRPEGMPIMSSLFDSSSQMTDDATQNMAATQPFTNTLQINWEHLLSYDPDLAMTIRDQFLRLSPFLRKAVEELITSRMLQAMPAAAEASASAALAASSGSSMQPHKNQYSISFYNLPEVVKIRAIRCKDIGRLMTITGTVTRTSEVRPELLYGSFICLECGSQSQMVEQQFRYTEPNICSNPTCHNRNRWQLDLERSVFADWQRVRVQENAQEIPSGSLPRCLDVILRNDIVEQAKAGDRCLFTGMVIVVPDVGKLMGDRKQRQLSNEQYDVQAPQTEGGGAGKRRGGGNRGGGGGEGGEGEGAAGGAGGGHAMDSTPGIKELGIKELSYKMCFLALHVEQVDGRSGGSIAKSTSKLDQLYESGLDVDDIEQVYEGFSTTEIAQINTMKADRNLYTNLAQSLAPNIYGHDLVKKGILLMLFGGVHKTTEEGINLRGDINVCVVGDPSTAKSQFLKQVSHLIPRAIYTSGKASSAAGLTAAVVRDGESGEFTIEAGALMLADNGVCCIDEFDKMDIKDQVAIHEAMEQQTISIAKAGIRATLNARSSILAAANPIGGRYNPRKTLRANLGITPAIMSRFDLFFVVQDECDEQSDYNIASHIIDVRQNIALGTAFQPVYSPEAIKLYLKFARTIHPELSERASLLLVESYRKLRQNDKVGSNSYRITVRQLESLIRLSEALARLHAEQTVEDYHVQEAIKLLRTSITKVDKEPIRIDVDASASAQEEEEADREDRIMAQRMRNQKEADTQMERTIRNRKRLKHENLDKIDTEIMGEESRRMRFGEELKKLLDKLSQTDDVDHVNEYNERISLVQHKIMECDHILAEHRKTRDKLKEEIDGLSQQQALQNYGSKSDQMDGSSDKDGKQKRGKKRSREDGDEGAEGADENDSSQAPKHKKKKQLIITWDKYKEVADLIVGIIRDAEEGSAGIELTGMVRRDLVDAYVRQECSAMTEQEIAHEITIVQNIIGRLINNDTILIDIDSPNQNLPDPQDHVLIVHPNYNPEA